MLLTFILTNSMLYTLLLSCFTFFCALLETRASRLYNFPVHQLETRASRLYRTVTLPLPEYEWYSPLYMASAETAPIINVPLLTTLIV